MRVVAYRIQARSFGALDKATLRLLSGSEDDEALGSHPFTQRTAVTRTGITLNPGALLTREWNGRVEKVMALKEGFTWSGKTYRSLSQVAKAITGTSWNGHRFFGLKAAPKGGVVRGVDFVSPSGKACR